MVQIGFLCSTSTHVESFLPLLKPFQDAFSEINFVWVSLDTFYNLDVDQTLNEHAIEFESPEVGHKHQNWLEQPLPLLYWQLHTHYRHSVIDILEKKNLDVLILGNDRGLAEKMFIHLANKRGILTVLLQDGLLWTSEVRNLNPFQRKPESAKTYLRDVLKEGLSKLLHTLNLPYLAPSYVGLGHCDLIAVVGDSSRKVLLKRGVKDEALYVTGQPRFDQLEQDILNIREKLGVDKRAVVIAAFTSAFREQRYSDEAQIVQEIFVKKLAQFVCQQKKDKAHLIFKPHPRENIDSYALPLHAENVSIVHHQFNSLEVINSADLIVTVPSTIVAEASLLRKPIYILRAGFPDKIATLLQLSEDFAEFDTFELFLPQLLELLNNEKEQQFSTNAEEIVCRPDGGSANQFVSLIKHRLLSKTLKVPQ